MTFYAWTYLFLILIIPLIFLLFSLSKNLKSFARKFYFMTISSFVFWMLFNFLYVNAGNEKIAVIFYSMLLVSVAMASGTLFLTAVNFYKRAGLWCYLTSLAPLFVLIFIVPRRIIMTSYGWQILYSPVFFAWEGLVLLVVFLGAYLLIKLKTKIRSKVLKKKLDYIIASSLLSVFLGIIATFLAFFLSWPSVSGVLASLAVMIAYPAFKK